MTTPAAPPPPSSRRPAPLSPTSGIPDPPTDRFAVSWVECNNCGKKNRKDDVFCYFCGQLLAGLTSSNDTRIFADSTDSMVQEDYFGEESVLLLIMPDVAQRITVRPQTYAHEVVLGRDTDNNAMAPDIDLSGANAANMGVSRLHLSIKHLVSNNALQIQDLGSSNGTFLNGERLHPQEQRILRHGDLIRMGRLTLQTRFLHPGEEVSSPHVNT
jgi:hypothetical protein